MTTKDDDPSSEPRDRWFNPYRQSRTDKAKALVADAISAVEAHEQRHQKRKRRRRPDDQEKFEAAVSSIICDVAYNHLVNPRRKLAITRSRNELCRRSRYRPAHYGKTIPDLLDALASPDVGLITLQLGAWLGGDSGLGGKLTTIHASRGLLRRMKRVGIGFMDFGLGQGEETIYLRATREDRWDRGKLLDYDDTDTTHRYRAEMETINHWLEQAEIWFDEGECVTGKPVDTDRRRLRRRFTNGHFESGGRLWGGFWQDVKKERRRDGVWIDGEPTVELDYGQVGPRLAYSLAGATPPSTDLYLIPGLELFRDGVKKLFSAVLFAEKPLTKKPMGTGKLLPSNRTISDLIAMLASAHPAIADQFFTGIGHHLQFLESQIMVRLLLMLIDEEITALPIHDAVIVAESNADRVEQLMKEVFLNETGLEGMVSRKEPSVRLEVTPAVQLSASPQGSTEGSTQGE